jgi:hypothetical protein
MQIPQPVIKSAPLEDCSLTAVEYWPYAPTGHALGYEVGRNWFQEVLCSRDLFHI